MTKFKVGDKVCEIGTGDIGIVTRTYVASHPRHIYVMWQSGEDTDSELHIDGDNIELIENENENEDLDHMILTLIKAGYIVYKKE